MMTRTGRMTASEKQDTCILRGLGVICIDDLRNELA